MSLSRRPAPADGREYDVLCVGESSLDVVGEVVEAAPAGGKGTLRSLDLRCGGQAATAAVAARRLGWRSVWAGVLGDDAHADGVEKALTSEGVAVRASRRRGVASRTAMIELDARSGQRTILEHRDARLDMEPAEVDRVDALVAGARLLLVDGTDVDAAARLARTARSAGVPVIVDLDRPAPQYASLLELVDVLVVPSGFARRWTGLPDDADALSAMAARFGPWLAVTTLGAEGSIALAPDGQVIRTAAPAVEVVDTTGAGDAFRAGLAAGWLAAGPGQTIAGLLHYANVVAALSCRGRGAQGGLPRPVDLVPYV